MNTIGSKKVFLCIIALLLVSVAIYGIWSVVGIERSEVRNAMRKLAPDGGSGIKEYFYPTGQLKEKAHWSNFEVTCLEYYDKSGDLLFVSHLQNGQGITITVSDDGEITEIIPVTDFAKDFTSFILKDGRLAKIYFEARDGTQGSSEISAEGEASINSTKSKNLENE